MMLVMFMLVNVSVVIMRRSGLQNYRPTFRAPLCPWLQITAILLYGFLIFEMGTIPLLLTGAFALAALVWFMAYVWLRIQRESAFIYLVKNILSIDMERSGLEDELKQITLERDDVALDRFDHLVDGAAIIDAGYSMSAKEMFRQVAGKLSPRISMDEEELYRLFIKREMESSTVVHPGVAVPHIVVPGEHLFDLVLLRCREGVAFSETTTPVTTVFVLVGSKDERNYHLRALMTIAHIIEERGFTERWKKARGEEELRDTLLLSKRRRDEHPLQTSTPV